MKTSLAVVQKGVAKADGKLTLTSTELIFEPFNKSMGLGPYSLDRNTIAMVDKSTGKGAGILPLTKDAITIALKDGKDFTFIVANPNDWLTLLQP